MPKPSLSTWLRMATVAGLYALTAGLGLLYFAPDGKTSVFFMASGVALAAIVAGGRQYVWAVLAGAILINLLHGKPWLAATAVSIGSSVGAWLGAWLLQRDKHFNKTLHSLRDYLRLIGLGGCVACLPPAVVGTLALLFTGTIDTDSVYSNLLYWWMGDTLGVIVVAPLILTWSDNDSQLRNPWQLAEATLIIVLTFAVSQWVFDDRIPDSFGGHGQSHWLFLLAGWAAVRVGHRAITLTLTVTAIETMLDMVRHHQLVFERGHIDLHALSYWFFMVVLAVVSMALANYLSEHQRTLAALNDKDELFQTLLQAMPDKIWLKNPNGIYLLCNHSFELLYGASEQQIVGKTDYDFVDTDLADFFREHDFKAIAAGKPNINQEWLHDADGGKLVLYETIKTPVTTKDGKLIGVLGMARDITQLYEAQQALSERIKEQKCLHAVFRASEDLLKPLPVMLQTVAELLPSAWHYPEIAAARIEWDGQRYSTADFDDDAPQLNAPLRLNGRLRGSVTVAYPHPSTSVNPDPFLAEEQVLLNAVTERLTSVIQRRQLEDNARKREEIFRTIVSQATDAITLIDIEATRFVEFNDAACAGLGYSRDEFAQLAPTDIQAEFSADAIRRILHETVAYGSMQMDTLHHHKDGSPRNVRLSLRAISLQDGDYLSLIWSDITERKQIEEQFRNLFAHNPAPMLIYERRTLSLVAVNDAFTALYGYDWQQATQLKLTDLYPPEDRHAIAEHIADLRGFANIGEWRHVLKDGTIIPIVSSSHDIVFSGHPCRVAVITNITELKQAETELRKFWLAVEQSPNSIVITNLNADIEYVNQRFTEVTGYSREEAIGANPRILQSGHTTLASYNALWANLTQGASWSGELINRRKDGSEYIEWAQIAPVRQSDGTISHYLAIKEDITEQKRTEAELEAYRHHLEELVQSRTVELEQARLDAEAANRSKSAFLANMSHEIRTPMNAILGMSHLLQGELNTASQREKLNKITLAGKHLLGLINDILDLSKIEAERLIIEQAPIHLAAIIDHACGMMSERVRDKGLTLRQNIDPQLLHQPLLGDPLRIGQILINYLGNAVKFTERGEIALTVTCLRQDEQQLEIRFDVRDSGIGLSEEQQQRVFEAFEQGQNSTTRKYGGTGLGLAISRHLARMMGGEVGVDSIVGQGSTFWFTATLNRGTTHARHALPANRADFRRDAVILLAEDNEINQEVARQILESVGLEVDVANHGGEALSKAETRRYDLILMDMQMPVMDGLQATALIRQLPSCQNLPIIAMTANAFEEDRRQCFAAGMNDFLAKPVDADILFAMLAHWIPSADAATTLAVPAPTKTANLLSGATAVDTTAGLRSFNGNEGQYRRMLQRFLDNHGGDADTIAAALTDGDSETARHLAHALKGVAATLGIGLVHEQAATLEQAVKSAADISNLSVTTTRLKQALAAANEDIAILLTQATADETAPTLAPEQLAPRLRELQTLLAADNMRASEVWREVAPLLATLTDADATGHIDRQVANYDLPAALDSLNRLLETYPHLTV